MVKVKLCKYVFVVTSTSYLTIMQSGHLVEKSCTISSENSAYVKKDSDKVSTTVIHLSVMVWLTCSSTHTFLANITFGRQKSAIQVEGFLSDHL